MSELDQAREALLVRRVQALMDLVSRTNETYRRNFQKDVDTFPIPFFGNILTAKVLTVGVNPSPKEFVGRGWPARIDAEGLTRRLLNYFEPKGGAHPWFNRWKEALGILGIAYERGEAAHMDLSPRATVPMRSVPDRGLFLRMIREDLPGPLEFIHGCAEARLVLIAGTVTKRWYINDFLASHCGKHQAEIIPRPRASHRSCLYEWRHRGKSLPLFFSSVSPSDPTRSHLLAENVRMHAEKLRALLQ